MNNFVARGPATCSSTFAFLVVIPMADPDAAALEAHCSAVMKELGTDGVTYRVVRREVERRLDLAEDALKPRRKEASGTGRPNPCAPKLMCATASSQRSAWRRAPSRGADQRHHRPTARARGGGEGRGR